MLDALAAHINQPHLVELSRRFLHKQLNPDGPVSMMSTLMIVLILQARSLFSTWLLQPSLHPAMNVAFAACAVSKYGHLLCGERRHQGVIVCLLLKMRINRACGECTSFEFSFFFPSCMVERRILVH